MPERQRRPFHLYVDEYQSFATKTFPELQSEARKYGIDTVVAHQYRAQLDDDNLGSTLNVANLIVLQSTRVDAGQLAAQFNLAPPDAETRFEPVRFWLMKSVDCGQKSDQQDRGRKYIKNWKVRVNSIQTCISMTNILAQLPNHQALCRLLEDGTLKEYRVNLYGKSEIRGGEKRAANIRLASRNRATPREQVEELISKRTASKTKAGEQTAGSYPNKKKALRIVGKE